VKRSVFSDVKQYSLINIYQYLEGNLCLLSQGSTLKMVAVTVKTKEVGFSYLFLMIHPTARRHMIEGNNLRNHSLRIFFYTEDGDSNPEDGGSRFLRNIGDILSYPRIA
jgi:hypothetical protein